MSATFAVSHSGTVPYAVRNVSCVCVRGKILLSLPVARTASLLSIYQSGTSQMPGDQCHVKVPYVQVLCTGRFSDRFPHLFADSIAQGVLVSNKQTTTGEFCR